MPVLMNKGANPRNAAWLFYTDRESFEALARLVRDERLDTGLLVVDERDLADARKASSEVPVYLQATALVPDDVDVDAMLETLAEAAQAEGDEDAAGRGDGNDGESDEDAPYEPVPVPEGEGVRIAMGTTTAQAARDFLVTRDLGDGETWTPELPGLQALAHIARAMAESGKGIPPCLVWHVDPDGIMRMAPAKAIKPMAGNVLKVKL